MENTSLVDKRKAAYKYIKDVVDRIPAHPIDEITELANVISGKFGMKDDLRVLKEGTSNPTERLIQTVKDFVGPTVPDFEISAKLIEPFKPSSQ